jgi:hypothetical protein
MASLTFRLDTPNPRPSCLAPVCVLVGPRRSWVLQRILGVMATLLRGLRVRGVTSR